MLKNIKSVYIQKVLFSFLKEKRKLKLLKCNKRLKKIININLINYRTFSGRYFIYENGEKIKEYSYFNDALLFEGEYLNNERNGKGKEYYENGKLKFEGEYINGLRNGKGVEYYDNGTLKFVGEYLNDNQWNGEGYYSKYGNIYNLKEGKGFIKEYFNEQKIFEGEYKNGEKNGYCKEYYKDGMIKFEGQYFYGKNGLEMDMMLIIILNIKLKKEEDMLKLIFIIQADYYLKVNI